MKKGLKSFSILYGILRPNNILFFQRGRYYVRTF